MNVLRTDEDRFDGLDGFPFDPRYAELKIADACPVRMHYVDEGPRNAPPILLVHGLPTWSYLFREMIEIFVSAGSRAVAPDLIGFGRSDKPSERTDYTLERHIEWLRELVLELDLSAVTLLCHDWGGPVGLGAFALEPDRFSRIMPFNTMLHTVEADLAGRLADGYAAHRISETEVVMGASLLNWLTGSQRISEFSPGVALERMGGNAERRQSLRAAYDAPFPDERYKVGLRQFPLLNPFSPLDKSRHVNLRTWDALGKFDRPFRTAYSDSDPSTGGWAEIFQQRVPGAAGQAHVTFEGAGHFLPEERPRELAETALDFILHT
jgi:haloalkane dehalogenase